MLPRFARLSPTTRRRRPGPGADMAGRRLTRLLHELTQPTPVVGTLKLGGITFDVHASASPTRLPHSDNTILDAEDTFNSNNLYFMLQKYLLGQDIFLLSQPGPYARRLAMTFCSITNSEYEFISLHRDVGETELKQGRELRHGGNLSYVDSAAVRAAKHGRILIIEGIEKAERGIMPVLNNLLENREMNLDDGTHIIHQDRFFMLDSAVKDESGKRFIPAHKDFRVVAIAAPVPPYTGYPIDPPFRSRFQARFVDPVGALMSLSPGPEFSSPNSTKLYTKLQEIILTTQYASESSNAVDATAKSNLRAFPQTALAKLRALLSSFPAPSSMSPHEMAKLMLVLNPGLLHAPFLVWSMLSHQTEEAGLGPLGSPSLDGEGDDLGLLGYRLISIGRESNRKIRISFAQVDSPSDIVTLTVPGGPKPLLPFPWKDPHTLGFLPTDRFIGLLTSMLQAHALDWDISYVPPVLPSTASCSTTTLVQTFGALLGYEVDSVHMYKELGGRELVMRRKIEDGGATSWEPSPLIEGAWEGRLVHLSGVDVIGPTAGSLARLLQDRETELWEGKRVVQQANPEEISSGELSVPHPSFRVIVTASKSIPLKDWLSDEHANMFFPVPSLPMSQDEESTVLRQIGCPPDLVDVLLRFADKYRSSMTSDLVQKNRKLGTRALIRIAKRLATLSGGHATDLYALLSHAVLAEFLPATERMSLETIFDELKIYKKTPPYHPPSSVVENALEFPAPSDPSAPEAQPVRIPLFNAKEDPEGVASHVPHMNHFYDNSLQTALMRDLAIDLEVLGEHLVLLGNQGVGKNKVVDRLCQLLNRPREYIQLHRDSTVNQLMFTTSLEGGIMKYTDSPLLRAIKYGRVIIIDEADKAAEHVVAIFKSLAGQGELTLSDGRRVRRHKERETDVIVHPNFRLILLANRPGYPFLGNHFLQVLGDNFSCHSVTNPDMQSERKLLEQLAPELSEDLILRLVAAFHDLRHAYEAGTLTYPYSLRELINLVRHLQAYPEDPLEVVIRNIFDFDVYRPATITKLAEILDHHGLVVKRLGIEAAREGGRKKILDVKYEPKNTELSEPKHGKDDPKNESHEGGNTWAGGTGGRDTAGIGGRGGYKRLYKGHDIKQVSDQLKNDVPDEIKEKAREMARQELARRLEELNMSEADAKAYGVHLEAVQGHIVQLHDLLENLSAKEEERVWVKRQTDGELDDTRLTEGLTGEAAVYKRRGMAKPEMGRPQIKPKRIRFLFDISASMYRFQYDGRLARSLETAVMLMETFAQLTRQDKYVWDMIGHCGDSPDITLVEAHHPPAELRDRWKVLEKMDLTTQYSFAGDYTVEALRQAVNDVAKFDADEWFVIAITDANFGRYNISSDLLKNAMSLQPKVKTALICIGEGAEASWIPRRLPGSGFRVSNTAEIPAVFRSILSSMVDH
ncbi:AAA domain-containing protein [Irpex rosettiformis]|uniref:AAA domain-containing protein n=1 Tax=Irpex rosettiformis TaxID=378272 RepID=A0ACB8U5N3_9APHY|nr:AAA domain-containing protein [Irpex rosettiformis]